MTAPPKCQGCGRFDGEVYPARGKHGVEITVSVSPIEMVDYGRRLLCRQCRHQLYQLIKRLDLDHRTRHPAE
jgi:hypothetical protein